MCTITANEFKQNMKGIFDRASSGEDIVISRGNEYFLVTKMEMNPVITPELEKRLQQARELISQGDCIEMNSHEDIDKWLNSL